jgi:acyl carrier protein
MKQSIADIISSIRPELSFDAVQDTELFGVLDSLDVILVVDEIEKQLGVTIEADQIVPENFSSLHVLEAFVRSRAK